MERCFYFSFSYKTGKRSTIKRKKRDFLNFSEKINFQITFSVSSV
jgi:hypothetical protein